jgi:DNA (cytosine-5)-methyltransferase 1
MLGNAVPSLMAEVVARAIAVQLLGQKPYVGEPILLPPDRGTPPVPEALLPVARPYRALIDDHADHPGTGLGRRARLRIKEAA